MSSKSSGTGMGLGEAPGGATGCSVCRMTVVQAAQEWDPRGPEHHVESAEWLVGVKDGLQLKNAAEKIQGCR